MRRTNYQRDKRQIDLEKKRKKEEKKLRKLERKGIAPLSEGDATEPAGESPRPREDE